MRFGKKTLLAAGVAAAFVASVSGALAQQKPEETLKMRQGLMQAVKMQAGPLLGFAQGKNDLPADAQIRGENLAALAKISPIAWAPGSENLEGNKTKADAYGSADFAKGWQVMAIASTNLASAAKTGNADLIKGAAGELGRTCKGCHDNFKKD